MEQQSQQLEKIFRDAFEQHTMKPSAKVLRNIKFGLWKSDFFSLKPFKLNVVYFTLILGGAVAVYFVANKSDFFNKEAQSVVTTTPSKIADEPLKNDLAAKSIAIEKELIAGSEKETSEMIFSAAFDADDVIGCVPHTVHFKNHSVRATSYNWEFGDGNKSVYRDPTYTYTEPGDYRATLTVKSKEGDAAAYTKEIKVLSRPEAAIAIDVDKSVISTKKIVFKNLSKEAKSYKWDFGDNNQSLEKDATHSYTDFATYKVTLVAEKQNGCTDTATLNNHFIDKNYELAFPFSFRPNTTEPVNEGFYGNADAEGFVFYPKNYGTKIYELKILTPNGLEVFNTTNIQQGWNGYIRGRLAPAGNYTYIVKGIYPNGKSFDLKGSFRVIIEDLDSN